MTICGGYQDLSSDPGRPCGLGGYNSPGEEDKSWYPPHGHCYIFIVSQGNRCVILTSTFPKSG